MVSCDPIDHGCGGGWVQQAFKYLEKDGAASDGCYPYTSGEHGVSGTCKSTCEDGSEIKRYRCEKGSVVMGTNPDQIKSDLITNGPMETRFDVYEDFMSYKSGVYQYTWGGRKGGHAIKLVGWGQEGDLNYWICANSWGDKWGEKGFFRIAWHNCGIDATVMGCTPDLKSPYGPDDLLFMQ